MSADANRHSTDTVSVGSEVTYRTRIWISSFLFAGLVLGTCLAASAPAAFAADSHVNRKAPEFVREDLNGTSIDLRSYRGKVVLLDFWATWCAPCQIEMPFFAAWQREYGPQGLQVIGISMDDDPGPVRRLVAKMKLNYPVAMGDATLGEQYGGVLGLPLTYLIDRNGVVRTQFKGEIDVKTIEKQLKLMLAHR
ncbi:MAG TPA: TlpA disulfide reductase family protein [Terracidiphilus sp.]|nr:TlpA disulfide reductase family protein [Terracidiphilus sp.]